MENDLAKSSIPFKTLDALNQALHEGKLQDKMFRKKILEYFKNGAVLHQLSELHARPVNVCMS